MYRFNRAAVVSAHKVLQNPPTAQVTLTAARYDRGSSSVLFAYLFLLLFGQIGNIHKVEQDSLYFFS